MVSTRNSGSRPAQQPRSSRQQQPTRTYTTPSRQYIGKGKRKALYVDVEEEEEEEEKETEAQGTHELIQVIEDDDEELLFASDNARDEGEEEEEMATIIELLKEMKQEIEGMKQYMDVMER